MSTNATKSMSSLDEQTVPTNTLIFQASGFTNGMFNGEFFLLRIKLIPRLGMPQTSQAFLSMVVLLEFLLILLLRCNTLLLFVLEISPRSFQTKQL
jgi:hypothetical protein